MQPAAEQGLVSLACCRPHDAVTRLSATMVVPESPKNPGSSPAFWFGVQTEKGDGALVQPIMAKELGYRPGSPSSFYMFQEIFDWVRARICLRLPSRRTSAA